MKIFNTASRFLDKKNVIPVLSGYKLDFDGENLTVTATNLDKTFSGSMPCSGRGKAVVDGNRLSALLARMPDATFTLGDKLVVRSNGGRAEIPLFRDDFPVVPLDCDDEPIRISAEALRDVFSACLCGTDEDKLMSTSERNVILFRVKDKKFLAASSDTQRLVVVKGECDSLDREIQIPVMAARTMLPLLEGNVTIKEDRNHIFFFTDSTFVFRKTTAKFPNIDAYLNAAKFEEGFTVSAQEMRDALELVYSLMDERLKSVKWTLAENNVIFSINSEAGYIEQVLDVTPSQQFVTGYNLTWLLPIVRQIDGDVTCEFFVNGDNHALKMTRQGETETSYIIQSLKVRS